MNRPREDVMMDPQIWFDTAKDFHDRANEPKPTPPPPSVKPKEPPKKDPWARFRGFSTFREPVNLGEGFKLQTASLQPAGPLGATHSLIRRGDAARRAAAEKEKERDKTKTAEGTNELLDETNQILREALL